MSHYPDPNDPNQNPYVSSYTAPNPYEPHHSPPPPPQHHYAGYEPQPYMSQISHTPDPYIPQSSPPLRQSAYSPSHDPFTEHAARPTSSYWAQPVSITSPPPPPPLQTHTPDPVHNPYNLPPPAPTFTPVSGYNNHQEDSQDEGEDPGDMPLLRRTSHTSTFSVPQTFPGGFAEPEPETNIRYGHIPQRVPRRYKTIKKVELFHGNFVLDSAVPTKLLERCALRTEREFTYMRYSAATCDPNDFKDSGFTLRQVLYDPPRRTELFIVLTMYNEDEELFARSMHGVIKNIAHLCKRDRSKTWGKDGWKKVVVCIVSDGRAKVNSRTLSAIAAMGVYQEGIAKNAVNGKPVSAHIYEYTTQVTINPSSLNIEGSERGHVPVQVLFCLKEKNQKKINSHRWFFNAFGPILQPNVCVLIDVGTMPGPTSIYHLWKAFDINSNVGGACGEIVALKGKYGQHLLNPLVAAQNFEYKISNILDKPLESVFGYITVLPGAFSAYRYIALQNDVAGQGPLQKYFLGETMHGAGADIFTANMYLAEDRILCWELVSKRGAAWTLHYVKSAYGVTDTPDQVPELVSQRRRWLNGSFFAAIHSTFHFHYIYRSSHSFMRKFWIHVELIYQVFNLIFSWFALGNYYIAFRVLTNAMEDPSFGFKGIHIANLILEYFYIGLLIMCFILALGNRPQGSKWAFTLSFMGFAILTLYMTFAAIFIAVKGVQGVSKEKGGLTFSDVFNDSLFRNIVLSIAATTGLYLISSLIFLEPWHMITSFVQYLLMAPAYINVLNVYAFANVHDVSWGTKGDNKVSTDLGVVKTGKNKNEVEVVVPTAETDINAAYEDALHVLTTKPPPVMSKPDPATEQEDYYRTFRTNVLLAWTLSNALLAAAITTTTGSAADKGASSTTSGYTAFLLYSVAGLAFVRFVGATTYMVVRLFAGE